MEAEKLVHKKRMQLNVFYCGYQMNERMPHKFQYIFTVIFWKKFMKLGDFSAVIS